MTDIKRYSLTPGMLSQPKPRGALGHHPDMSGQYNTSLTPQQLTAYGLLYSPQDSYDYDMMGAFAAGVGQGGNGHYPDTYKKPNHPTFSSESQYSTPQQQGGTWEQLPDGNWVFRATNLNMQNLGVQGILDYFRNVEPGNQVQFPPQYYRPNR